MVPRSAVAARSVGRARAWRARGSPSPQELPMPSAGVSSVTRSDFHLRSGSTRPCDRRRCPGWVAGPGRECSPPAERSGMRSGCWPGWPRRVRRQLDARRRRRGRPGALDVGAAFADEPGLGIATRFPISPPSAGPPRACVVLSHAHDDHARARVRLASLAGTPLAASRTTPAWVRQALAAAGHQFVSWRRDAL